MVDQSLAKKPIIPKGAANLIGLVIALLVIFGFFCWKLPNSFPTARNIETLARQTCIVSLVALGMTYVIISGAIDLSVGSILAFVTMVIAALLIKGYNPWIAALGGLLAGALCGFINGALVTSLKVGPFIVTLGSLLIVRGVAKWVGNEQSLYPPKTWLNSLLATLDDSEKWKLLPVGVYITILCAIAMGLMLKYTRFGRHVVAIGSNEQAARLCGVPINWTYIKIFTLTGLFAGLGGIMLFSRLTVGDPTVAVGFELDAIAAVVIGGASLAGGEGNIAGSILGAMIMTTIRAGGSQMGLHQYVQEILTGTIIVVAVALDRVRVRLQQRS